MSSNLGRHVFGAAVFASGLITLTWHDYNGWHEPRYLVDVAAAAQIVGGAALLFGRTAKAGALAVGAVYLVFALLCVPRIATAPQIYNNWGNFFEQFAFVTGAVIVYGRLSSSWAPQTLNRIGRILFGLCTASFALEQAIYLAPTAALVPKWLPPSQLFWAVTTTVAFALAAVALLTNRLALLATRLTTAMILIFDCSCGCRCCFPIPTVTQIGAKPPKPSRSRESCGFSQIFSAGMGKRYTEPDRSMIGRAGGRSMRNVVWSGSLVLMLAVCLGGGVATADDATSPGDKINKAMGALKAYQVELTGPGDRSASSVVVRGMGLRYRTTTSRGDVMIYVVGTTAYQYTPQTGWLKFIMNASDIPELAKAPAHRRFFEALPDRTADGVTVGVVRSEVTIVLPGMDPPSSTGSGICTYDKSTFLLRACTFVQTTLRYSHLDDPSLTIEIPAEAKNAPAVDVRSAQPSPSPQPS